MKESTIYKLNSAGFIITAISSYQGAMKGVPVLGLAVFALLVALFLPVTKMKKERVLLTVIVGVIGFVLDSALIHFGVYSVKAETRWLLPAPLCPDWVIALWLNFGFMLYIYWFFLRRSYLLSAVIGLVFSIMIYGNAHRNGFVELGSPAFVSLVIVAILWAILIPAITKLAIKFFSGGVHDVSQTK